MVNLFATLPLDPCLVSQLRQLRRPDAVVGLCLRAASNFEDSSDFDSTFGQANSPSLAAALGGGSLVGAQGTVALVSGLLPSGRASATKGGLSRGGLGLGLMEADPWLGQVGYLGHTPKIIQFLRARAGQGRLFTFGSVA